MQWNYSYFLAAFSNETKTLLTNPLIEAFHCELCFHFRFHRNFPENPIVRHPDSLFLRPSSSAQAFCDEELSDGLSANVSII
jgi:hypothetical protein